MQSTVRSDVDDSDPLKASEQRLEEASSPFQKTVVEGAMIGAVIGGLLGVLAGGDRNSAAKGAVVGAAIGGVSGYYVAKKQKHYASEEARIDSMIADVKATNADLEAYIAAVKDYVAKSTAKAKILKEQMQEDKITRDELDAQFARIDKQRINMVASLESLKEKKDGYLHAVEEQKSVSGEKSVAELDGEIKALAKQIDTLEVHIAELDKVLEVKQV
jgi:uncharacterized protein YcfJ